MEIDWNAIDRKWQKKWLENNDHETDSNDKEKKFITVAYPYPNSPQHIGHGRTYTIADVHSRYLRMKGFNVLFPMGFHYTGTPILGMAKRVEANDAELIEGFKTLYKVPEDKIKEFVDETRNQICNILQGKSKKLILIVGPCSIHDYDVSISLLHQAPVLFFFLATTLPWVCLSLIFYFQILILKQYYLPYILLNLKIFRQYIQAF